MHKGLAICDRCAVTVESLGHRLPRGWSNVIVSDGRGRYENPSAEICGICAVEVVNENFRSRDARETYDRIIGRERQEVQNEDTSQAFTLSATYGVTAMPMVSEGS